MRNYGHNFVAVLLVALCLTGSAGAVEVIFQDGLNGYTGTEDTYLRARYHPDPNFCLTELNYGGSNLMRASGAMWSGNQVTALVRFADLFGEGANQIPDGVIITSAKMQLYSTFTQVQSRYIGWRDMINPWVQGAGDGEIVEGASCGEARRYRASGDYSSDPCDAWGNDGLARNCEVDPCDFFFRPGPRYPDEFGPGWFQANPPDAPGWIEFDVTSAIERCYNGEQDNWGFYSQTQGSWDWVHFYTSEAADANAIYRPRLVVEYLELPAPPSNTAVFKQGFNNYFGCEDLRMVGLAGSEYTNYGADERCDFSGSPTSGNQMTSLIRFNDIFGTGEGQIPPGAVITSATLKTYVYFNRFDALCRVYAMESGWTEGSSVNDEEGVSSHAVRHYRSDGDYAGNPADAWGAAGVAGTGPVSSVDYANAFASYGGSAWPNPEPEDPCYGTGWMEFDVAFAVQAWNEGTLENNGFLGYSTSATTWPYVLWLSSESGDVLHRPELIVEYTEAPPVTPGTWRFKQGFDNYFSCEDNTISGLFDPGGAWDYRWSNYGGNPRCDWSGFAWGGTNKNPSLIRFNDIIGAGVGQVPPGTLINAATLRTYIYFDRAEPSDNVRVYEMESDWVEGNSNWNPGFSCMNVRHYISQDPCDYTDPADCWGTAGVIDGTGPVNGVDWHTDADPHYGISTRAAMSDPCDWMEFDVTPIVQAWIDGTKPNYGFYGYSSEPYFVWYSSESGEVLLRPELVIRGPACGDPCYPPPPADVNGDCFVNEDDVLDMVGMWLGCTDPQGQGCVQLQSPDEVMYMHHCYGRSVDGYLTDWTDPCWVPLDQIYYGDPCDLTSAKYTVCWDPCEDRFHGAIVVEDNDQVFESSPTNWDTSDRIEIYVQADPNGGDNWGSGTTDNYDKAQQYIVGYGGTIQGVAWAVFGNGIFIPEGEVDPGDAEFIYEGGTRVSGTTITYEFSARAWQWYGGKTVPIGSVPSEVRPLAPGLQVGFDLIVDSRWGPPPHTDYQEFGMLSNNVEIDKFRYADTFQRWELLDYDGSIVPPECGDWGYLPADVNPVPDCYVDMGDLYEVAVQWMDCTDPSCQ